MGNTASTQKKCEVTYQQKYDQKTGSYFYQQVMPQIPLENEESTIEQLKPGLSLARRQQIEKAKLTSLRELNLEHLEKNFRLLICKFTRKLMQYPATMQCCKNIAEQQFLNWYVQEKKGCPFCRGPYIFKIQIKLNDKLYTEILGFKQSLVNIYHTQPQQEKQKFEKICDAQFGNGFALKNLKF